MEEGASGQGGNVNVTAGTLRVTKGAIIQSSTYGQGSVGSVSINVRDRASFDGVGSNGINSGAYSRVEEGASGQGGNVNVTAGSLKVTDGAVLNTSTFGRQGGYAGNVNINVRERADFEGQVSDFNQVTSDLFNSGAYSRVEPRSVGNAGSVNITANTLRVIDGAVLTTSTDGQGKAGNVTINAGDVIFDGEGRFNYLPGFGFRQSSGVFSAVKANGEGQGGNVNLTTRSVSVTNGAILFTSTLGSGNAGNILVNNTDVVTLSGVAPDGFSSGLYSSTELGAKGRGGEITVNSAVLQVQDGAVINAQTRNTRNGGSVTINANTFEATNGGQVLTTARNGGGNGGNITFNILNNVTLSGSDPAYAERFARFGQDVVASVNPASGLFANTDVNSTGAGGNIFLHSNQLTIRDGAVVTVSSQGSGIAGDIYATSRNVFLDKQGAIVTETFSSQGGNIKLQVQDLLLMRDNSRISATAGLGGGGGDGGNIIINAKDGFIVAFPFENSDITANAFEGKGGFIDITARRIFGLERREQLTPLSDITAFSQQNPQLNGIVQINTPDVDPSRGLVQLPTNLVDASQQIDTSCSPGSRQRASSFVVTGRGGLPPSPKDVITPDATQIDWVSVKPTNNNRSLPPVTIKPTTATPKPIVEATGWVRNALGEVELTANAPTTPHSSWQNPVSCRASKHDKNF